MIANFLVRTRDLFPVKNGRGIDRKYQILSGKHGQRIETPFQVMPSCLIKTEVVDPKPRRSLGATWAAFKERSKPGIGPWRPALRHYLTGDHFHSAYQANHFTVLDEFCGQPIGLFRLGIRLKYAHRCPRTTARRYAVIAQKPRDLLDPRHKSLVYNVSHFIKRVRCIDSDACVHKFTVFPLLLCSP
jgi:hypothetical protein